MNYIPLKMFIFRKIINILLKKILEKYKDDIDINKNDKLYVVSKKNYSNALDYLIDFFFFIKSKTSSIIHLLKSSKALLKELPSQQPLEEENCLKGIDIFLKDLELTSFEYLINLFNLRIPLIFFSKSEINKEKIINDKIGEQIYNLNRLKEKYDSNNLNKKYDELIIEKEEIEKELNNFNNDIKQNEFKTKCIFLLNKRDTIKVIGDLLSKEEMIENSINEYQKLKEKVNSTIFCFSDFIILFHKKRKVGSNVFNPHSVCISLLKNELKETVNFYENEIEDFIDFFKILKK